MEVLSRIVDVEAVDENDAIERVRQMYRKCQIVLDDSDYKETEISVYTTFLSPCVHTATGTCPHLTDIIRF